MMQSWEAGGTSVMRVSYMPAGCGHSLEDQTDDACAATGHGHANNWVTKSLLYAETFKNYLLHEWNLANKRKRFVNQ